jgi:hypothetical protein
MTKSRGEGRGGKRSGAGRPRKTPPTSEQLAAEIAAAVRVAAEADAAEPPDLPKLRNMALRTLEAIAGSTSVLTPPAARVSAAKALLAATAGGKKGGADKGDKPSRFAPRSPPRLAVDNTKA